MFENRLLRKEEETGGLRKLRRDRFRDLYYLPTTIVIVTFKEHQMCGVFGMLWGEEKCMQGFGAEM